MTENPYVIQPVKMIRMTVCKQNRINRFYSASQSLNAELRPNVHQQTRNCSVWIFVGYIGTASEPLIMRVFRTAYSTATGNAWNSMACAGP